jgi:hypothetical protein
METVVAGSGLEPDQPSDALRLVQPLAGAGLVVGGVLIDAGHFRKRLPRRDDDSGSGSGSALGIGVTCRSLVKDANTGADHDQYRHRGKQSTFHVFPPDVQTHPGSAVLSVLVCPRDASRWPRQPSDHENRLEPGRFHRVAECGTRRSFTGRMWHWRLPAEGRSPGSWHRPRTPSAAGRRTRRSPGQASACGMLESRPDPAPTPGDVRDLRPQSSATRSDPLPRWAAAGPRRRRVGQDTGNHRKDCLPDRVPAASTRAISPRSPSPTRRRARCRSG